jgi:hypothetical protein
LWNQHPEPTGSRWATPTSSEVQQNPGHPPEKQFLFLVSQTPYFALKVMRTLAQRLRAANKSLD